ncbi:MAG: hypothetical protein C4541_03735 [Candidatus Auribacter fodinae]|uniref:Polysaccharide export protein N-terminal domain-containing protein n=1 Tax=Candidatus Auribacter fodinae TaxID=2093366 RepID=A0A3A4R6J3_9BACT|nr:MAG: hypothetical protein C4541_03735 [Candidatus Auribacter fodinae]
MNRVAVMAAALFMSVALTGCNLFLPPPRVEPRVIVPEPNESADYERPVQSDIHGEYVLAPSDVIQVIVRGHEDLSGISPIRPDGRITMQLIDDVEVSGLTPAQVDDLITEELKKYLKEVNVSVSVVGFNSKQVHFIGPTGGAVQLPYTGEMTILDLVTRIGGVPEIAAPENTIIVRGDMNQPTMIKVNLKDIIYRGDYKDNILLRENDVVILPANFFSKIGLVVDNFTRGANAPSRVLSTVESNFTSGREFSNEMHRFFPMSDMKDAIIEDDTTDLRLR